MWSVKYIFNVLNLKWHGLANFLSKCRINVCRGASLSISILALREEVLEDQRRCCALCQVRVGFKRVCAAFRTLLLAKHRLLTWASKTVPLSCPSNFEPRQTSRDSDDQGKYRPGSGGCGVWQGPTSNPQARVRAHTNTHAWKHPKINRPWAAFIIKEFVRQ